MTGDDEETPVSGADAPGSGEETPASGGEAAPGEASGRSRRSRALSVLQWVLALGAFWYVARDVNWAATAADLASVPPAVVVAIAAVTTLEFGSRFSTWFVLLNGRVDTSLATTARVDLVIKFINHVIPSKASGHSVAPLVLGHYTDAEWTEAVSIAGLNTGLYATLYGVTALAGVALFAARLSRGWLVVILLSTAVYLVAGALVVLAGRRMDVAGRVVGRLERTRRDLLFRHSGDRVVLLSGVRAEQRALRRSRGALGDRRRDRPLLRSVTRGAREPGDGQGRRDARDAAARPGRLTDLLASPPLLRQWWS
jgi:hypothetical protein